MTSLWDAARQAVAAVESWANDVPIRVAVTGLSRSGKTVFLTSLVANLVALGNQVNTMPALVVELNRGGPGRLGRVRARPPGSSAIPYFDWRAKLADLAADRPAWPSRTEDLAEIALELSVKPPSGVLGALRGMAGQPRVTLELLDYPGEWLLDLPLLGMGYAEWSRRTLELLHTLPRVKVMAPFLDRLADYDPRRRADEALTRALHELYKKGLERCRHEHGLRYLQPGRFLTPGSGGDAPFLWFYPAPEARDDPPHGTGLALLRDRFEAYKADMRRRFFDDAFSRFSRQVVLVDVLGALHAGQAAYEDTERAIAEVAEALGSGGTLLQRLLGWSPIERIAFVATKADHVPAVQRDALPKLLADMATGARHHGPRSDGAVSYHAAASVVSTVDGVVRRDDGPAEPVVWGKLLEGGEARPYRVGTLPASRPPKEFWSHRYFELPVFRPPPIDPSGVAGVPHLNLDAVLAQLIGDRL